MKRLVISALLASLVILASVAPVLGHAAGHRGGCEDFGHVNRLIAQDPAAFGFAGARNLGGIVSSFAKTDDGVPGVGDVVESIDHAACG